VRQVGEFTDLLAGFGRAGKGNRADARIFLTADTGTQPSNTVETPAGPPAEQLP
jgi:hypothetical protein